MSLFCSKCGRINPEGRSFCICCGSRMEQERLLDEDPEFLKILHAHRRERPRLRGRPGLRSTGRLWKYRGVVPGKH